MPHPSTGIRLFQVAFAVLSCLLVAGVIFGKLIVSASPWLSLLIWRVRPGFAALKPVLVHEGVYASYCDTEQDGEKSRLTGRPCLEQDLKLNLSFTISVVLTNVGALPIGMTLDRIGPRYTSILGAMVFALGNVFLGIKPDSAGFDTFLAGYILLALGGPMIFLSSFHLCNAFPKRSGLILSSIIGAFDASSLPFVLYAAIYRRRHIALRTWFWLYTIISAIILIEQFLLAPKEPYLREKDAGPADEQTPLLQDDVCESTNARPTLEAHHSSFYDSSFSRIHYATDAAADGTHDESSHKDPITGKLWGQTALQQIATAWFWLPQLFLICYMLRINYEIATVYEQVLYYTKDGDLAQRVTDAFVVLLPLGGVVSIPFIGYLLDQKSSFTAFGALLILGLGYGVLCMTGSPAAQIVGIIMFTIMRPLMYTTISDYYTKIIGVQTFGTVYGFANAMSGLFNFAQYGIDYTVKRRLSGNYTPVNLALTAISVGLAASVMAKQYYGAWRQDSQSRSQASTAY